MYVEGSKIRLAIDTRSLSRPKTGVGAYTNGLVNELKKLDQVELREFNFGADKGHNMPARVIRQLNKFHLVPPIDWFIKADVFVFPDFVGLPVAHSPSAVVIHDLAFKHFPESLDQKNRQFLNKYVPRSLASSDLVIAVSSATKNDIIKIYDIQPDKIAVVYPGVDLEQFQPNVESHDEGPLRRYGIKPGAVMFLGTMEPRKSVRTLIDAYRSLPASIQAKHQLVLAGGDGWGGEGERLRSQVDGLNALFTGRVADHELACLYRNSSVVVLPSKFEGFGMTMIEAMACGRPVIGANNSSISEVIGSEAGLLFKTGDSQELASKLEMILTDNNLAIELTAKGRERAKLFSWQNSADSLIKALKGLTEGKNG